MLGINILSASFLNMSWLEELVIPETSLVGDFEFGNLSEGTIISYLSRTTYQKFFSFDSLSHYLSNSNVINAYPGSSFSITLSKSGVVSSWENNGYGQLGSVYAGPLSFMILNQDVFSLSNDEIISSIEVGSFTSFVITSKARVFSWGLNDYNSNYLGINQSELFHTFSPQQLVFDNLLEGEIIVDVQFDQGNHIFAVTNLGRIFTWGSNYRQYVNNNGREVNPSPELVLFD